MPRSFVVEAELLQSLPISTRPPSKASQSVAADRAERIWRARPLR
jgi:hypothetical protein